MVAYCIAEAFGTHTHTKPYLIVLTMPIKKMQAKNRLVSVVIFFQMPFNLVHCGALAR